MKNIKLGRVNDDGGDKDDHMDFLEDVWLPSKK
jgi:hypothetical protein